MSKTIEKKQFTLQGRDYWKGIGLGAIVTVIGAVVELITEKGDIASMDWGMVLNAAVIALLGYLGKNFVEKDKKVTIHE